MARCTSRRLSASFVFECSCSCTGNPGNHSLVLPETHRCLTLDFANPKRYLPRISSSSLPDVRMLEIGKRDIAQYRCQRCERGYSCDLLIPIAKITDALTYHNTQETYSPVGRRNRRMYWSGVQSTGADIKKYFTGNNCQQRPRCRCARSTYNYRLVGELLEHLGADFVELRCST